MDHRMKGRQWKNFKLALKRGFTYGLILELMFIGSGYLLYREYTTNRGIKPFRKTWKHWLNNFYFSKSIWTTSFSEFRERVEDEFPQMTEYYNTVSGLYLNVMPKRLRDQILIPNENDSSASTTQANVENAPKTTNSTAATATTAQAQPISSPKK